ncbi:MAG: carbamoyltransferase HypF [Actinomycetota bacterium]|nr:carbamoyltransferase HypF [Actinomycetota bacterium]
MRFLKIKLEGIVQGVGFRPFVYRIAQDHRISGSVSNNTSGVEIYATGEEMALENFLSDLVNEKPPQALIEDIRVTEITPFESFGFAIVSSKNDGDRLVLISPDLATCDECKREIFDPSDRRYRYPFTNCTNCGPRFTIIRDTPYDRPNTSMSVFKMCVDCKSEYNDPSSRRFHAQPNACPECGPKLRLEDNRGNNVSGEPLRESARVLRDGKVVAIKGLGGFHLACSAVDDVVVESLRERKKRYGKPFAVMVSDLNEARKYCEIDEVSEEIMTSPRCPIVLLPEREDSVLSKQVAPNLRDQGLFLPYTPVHHLLMREAGIPLVMTSGNVSSEPICTDNNEAKKRLNEIADFFLLHNRDILVRYDDSVTRAFRGEEYPVRRARGYAPYPLRVSPPSEVQLLAYGPELKNTFCLLRGDQAFLSQHIGDMDSEAELSHFEEALNSIARLFSLEPQIAACDMHPDYLTTSMARKSGLPCVEVQHHHAHIASCMADNRITGEVIGVAWDGTGYGPDGTIWGGEFMKADFTEFERLAHLRAYPMPGGDRAVYEVYRMVAGVLFSVLDSNDAEEEMERLFSLREEEREAIFYQLRNDINCPRTSGAGRMFDVAAAMSGVRKTAVYDGQAACEFEALASNVYEDYHFEINRSSLPWVIDTGPVFLEMLDDVHKRVSPDEISGKFHRTMALIIVETVKGLASMTGINRVALSGGVFQNIFLTEIVVSELEEADLECFLHRRVPANDGGVSLGQAMVASRAEREYRDLV